MNTLNKNDLMLLLHQGVEAANAGEKPLARAHFQQVLELEPSNETALLWLSYLTSDPYEAVRLLEKLITNNPRNELAQSYLIKARARCNELEQLVTGSATYNTWYRPNNGAGHSSSVPLLGEYLLSQGLITQQQLDMALRRHQDLNKRGNRKPIGQIMVELGYITQTQLDRWLEHQKGEFSNRFWD
jgi:tetratricopeptide (TPR) repeat protein